MITIPSLYVICDADVCEAAGWTLDDYAAACIEGGARLLQIRAKGAGSRWLLERVESIVGRAAGAATIVVNDRADVARLAGAAGVHVGQEDLAPRDARLVIGDDAIVGLSTHTDEQVARALTEPISYLAIGPVFGTTTKETGYQAIGLSRVADTAARVAGGIPIVAIGGITLKRAPEVIAAGASAVAVISDLLCTGDPRTRVAAFVRVLSRV